MLTLMLIVSSLFAINPYPIQANEEKPNVCLLKDEEGNYLLSEEEILECLGQQIEPYGTEPDNPYPPID